MKTLIVDDETISRKVLKKILGPVSECVTIDSGSSAILLYKEAIEKKEPFNLLTLDVSMPGIDGAKILGEIRKKEMEMDIPKTDRVKIIMISSRMNKLTIKNCIKLGCNGYITKPINKIQLYKKLENLGFEVSEDLGNDKNSPLKDTIEKIIENFYKGEIKLPVLPHIVQEVQNLLEKDDASIDDLAKIVEKDTVISGKLVLIANSPLYKGLDTIDNLNAGLLRLGMKATQSAISTIANKNLFVSKNNALKKLLEKLWMHSFACACCGKLIAKEIKFESIETIFLMGIVHDIGKILLLKAISDILPDETFKDNDLQIAIQEVHTTFGGVLLKKWKFSKEFIKIAELHHWNDFSEETEKELIIINLANYLAKQIGYTFFTFDQPDGKENDETDPKITELLKKLKIDNPRFVEIGEEAKVIINDSTNAF